MKLINTSWFILILLLTACGIESGEDLDTQQGNSNSATLSWEAPITNTDVTPLTDLAGYKIYFGSTSGNYSETIDAEDALCEDIGDKTECSYTLQNLNSGEYFFAVTAYDTSGNESNYSNAVSKEIQ